MDIIERAGKLVDQLVIGVAENAGKGPLFDIAARIAMVEKEIAPLVKAGAHITVKPFSNLLMDFAVQIHANVIVRGLRAVSDFEYEFQMAGMNYRINPDIETIFLMASEGYQFIASRFVKEIAALGGNVSPFVSADVVARLKDKQG